MSVTTTPNISFHYRRPRNYRSHEAAWKSGQFIRAAFFNDARARNVCRERGIEIRAAQQDENVATSGGFLVPDELAESIIVLREKWGVIAADAYNYPMGSDTCTIPRRPMGSGLSVTYANNNQSATATQLNIDAVSLVAKKAFGIVLMSSEFAEDAVVELADLFADEFGYALAKAEDQAGFSGDGTSTYAGQTGAAVKIVDGTHTAGVFQAPAGHSAFSTLTGSDFTSAMGLLPGAYLPTARWYISPAGWNDACQRLSATSGQSNWNNVEGIPAASFMGHRVRFCPSMYSSTSTSVNTVAALFGDLSAAVVIGRRRQMTVRTSDQRYFDSDQLALLGSQRFHVVAHGLGDTSNAGPLVALQFSAS